MSVMALLLLPWSCLGNLLWVTSRRRLETGRGPPEKSRRAGGGARGVLIQGMPDRRTHFSHRTLRYEMTGFIMTSLRDHELVYKNRLSNNMTHRTAWSAAMDHDLPNGPRIRECAGTERKAWQAPAIDDANVSSGTQGAVGTSTGETFIPGGGPAGRYKVGS